MSPVDPTVTTALRRRRSARSSGVMRAAVVALLGAVALSACIPLVSPSTSGRTYGRGPVDAVWAAAEAHPRCSGLSAAQLAAMMMVPTYPETGGPVPSPMTLGRWDNVNVWSLNANLFAFGQTSGPYVDAFFTAGVGMWQFDSAGGWNLTAAGAIDSVSAANQAATTIAFRYCNSPSSVGQDAAARRAYAWQPWYGCASWSNWNCEALYQQLYQSEMLDVAVDDTVGRYGGMEQRTCDVVGIGTGLTCWYVDPARAQGSTGGWRSGTYSPTNPGGVTPLPKPFYVLAHGGREYRYWLPADTGYGIGITGHKPITANARTSLTWVGSAPLCDRTAGRGQCASTPSARVATTPWGPKSGDPFGSVDTAVASFGGAVRLQGWAIDPDTNDSIDVHLYVDGQWGGAVTASVPRPDVAAVVPGYGESHGFDTVLHIRPGSREICAYAINVGPFGTTNPSIGCRTVVVSGNPGGNVETGTPVIGGVRVTGWAFDPDTSSPIDVRLSVDGVTTGLVRAARPRPDIPAAYPLAGPAHGFDTVVTTRGGARRVCAQAVNASGTGGQDALIGCRTVNVSSNPFGNLEMATTGPGGVFVSGWALDPDTDDASVRVSIDGVAVTTLPTDKVRADVASAFPGRGDRHGFAGVVPASGGTRSVCLTLVNQGPGADQALGCRSVVVASGNPFGNFEAATRVVGGVRLTGWVLDPDTTAPVTVHVYANGAWAGAHVADRPRPDVAFGYPLWGAAHGFDVTIPVGPGQSVCVYAINIGPGTTNPLMSCLLS